MCISQEISEALVRGGSVRLRSFGRFAVREKRGRLGRNSRTMAEATI
ncbi:HU family DNA-binding protein, partial [Methylocystis suflitae]